MSTSGTALRYGNRNDSDGKVAAEKPGALLGVSQAAEVELAAIGISTIFDLARSHVFGLAAEIAAAAADPTSNLALHGEIPKDWIKSAGGHKTLAEVAAGHPKVLKPLT